MMSFILFCLVVVRSHCLFSTLLQTLSEPSSAIWTMDMTYNNSMLVMGGIDRIVFVYSINDAQFNSNQNITDFGSDVWTVDITADGGWLLVVEFVGINRIYLFSYTENKFSLIQVINNG